MNHNGWHERQWRRIEDEYDEPPREVVRGLHHDMRLPICQIAELLCVSETTLRLWCHRWQLPTLRSGYAKRHVDGKVLLRARALGYESITQAIADLRASGLRWEDVQAALRCSASTVSRYIDVETRGRYALTEAGREQKRQTMRLLNARRPPGLKWGERWHPED